MFHSICGLNVDFSAHPQLHFHYKLLFLWLSLHTTWKCFSTNQSLQRWNYSQRMPDPKPSDEHVNVPIELIGF